MFCVLCLVSDVCYSVCLVFNVWSFRSRIPGGVFRVLGLTVFRISSAKEFRVLGLTEFRVEG